MLELPPGYGPGAQCADIAELLRCPRGAPGMAIELESEAFESVESAMPIPGAPPSRSLSTAPRPAPGRQLPVDVAVHVLEFARAGAGAPLANHPRVAYLEPYVSRSGGLELPPTPLPWG